MEKIIISTLLFFLLSSGSCEPDGHNKITAINKSSDTVIFALIASYGGDLSKINLGGSKVPPSGSYVWQIRGSYEDEISDEKPFEFYVVNPDKYNTPGIYYPLDSMYVKNDILKKYVLTLKDLEAAKWKITYSGK